MTTYGARVNVHPDRLGPKRTTPIRLIVVHTSEGSEGPTSAENLGAYLGMPGDRPNPDGSFFGSSYHYLTDTDRVLPAVPDGYVAKAAAGGNHDGLHVCIPGKAGQTRAQWLDLVSRGYIRQCADVLRDKASEFGIPLVRLPWQQVHDGASGYCGHIDVSLAFGKSTHTDPGAQFPWDVLAADLNESEEDDVKPFLWRPKGYLNVFIIVGADAMHASPATVNQYGLEGASIVNDDHPQTLQSVLYKSGIAKSQLVPA